MTPEPKRLGMPLILLLGLIAVFGGIYVYYLLLQSSLGAFRIQQALPFTTTTTERQSVAILKSDYTRLAHRRNTTYDPEASWVDGVFKSWRDFLLDGSRNIHAREIRDADVEAGDLHAKYDVLILPAVTALSDRQIANIKQFMDDGGNVWATWTTGIYKEDGTWRGWGALQDLFGVEFIDYVDRNAGNYQVYTDTFPGYAPPGLYSPQITDSTGNVVDTSYVPAARRASEPGEVIGPATASDDYLALRRRYQQEAQEMVFTPLEGFVWKDTLGTQPPQSSYASADTITATLRGLDGVARRQPAVVVSYYTWNGVAAQKTVVPYPYTGGGIRRMTLRANTPLTANVPGGYRVKTQIFTPGVRVRVVDTQHVTPFGFWYDFATDDLPLPEALETTTSSVYGTHGKGRFIYLGYQRASLFIDRSDPEDYEVLGILFANMLRYLREEPVIWMHDWPYPYTAAAMFAGVGGNQPQNLAAAADALQGVGVPGTYFVRPEQVKDVALLRKLYAQGDLGVYDDLSRNWQGSSIEQGRRFSSLRQMLEQAVGAPVTGYRPSHAGRPDTNTLGGLTRAKYHYFLPDSIGRRTVVKVMGWPNDSLYRYNYTVRHDSLGNGGTTATGYLQDILRVSYEGGLYRLVYSSDYLGTPANLGVLRTVAQDVKNRPEFWVAAGDDIARWWRVRRKVEGFVEERSRTRLVVRVTNGSEHAARDVNFSVALGQPVTGIDLRSEVIRPVEYLSLQASEADHPNTSLSNGNTILNLHITHLKPRQSVVYLVDLKGVTPPRFNWWFSN